MITKEATEGTENTEYLLYDGHGSTRQLVNSDLTVADSYGYDAYGVMLSYNSDAAANAQTSLLYAGEQYDSNLDQYYLRARYYNPLNGLFNRTDDYSGNPQDPQSLHKYLYCHANPVNRTDPTGRFATGTLAETSVTLSIQQQIGMSIAATVLLHQQIMDIDRGIAQKVARQEVEFFVQTAPEPFTQTDFEGLENRIKARTRSRDKEKLYLHYSFEQYKQSLLLNGLFPAGVINPKGSFATRDVYPTGWSAKWRLALPNPIPPDSIYIVFPRKRFGPTYEGHVPLNIPDDTGVLMGGGGYEYTFGNGSGGTGTVFGPICLPQGTFGEWN